MLHQSQLLQQLPIYFDSESEDWIKTQESWPTVGSKGLFLEGVRIPKTECLRTPPQQACLISGQGAQGLAQ